MISQSLGALDPAGTACCIPSGAYRHGRAGILLLLCICLQSIVAFRTVPNLGAFLERLDPTAVKWSDILCPIEEIPGVAAVSIWRYEAYHEVFPEVLNTLLGRPRPDIPSRLEKRMHPGLSEQALQACCIWHAAGYGGRLVAAAREDFPISDVNPKFASWPDELLRESQAAYGQDIEALVRAPKITVLE